MISSQMEVGGRDCSNTPFSFRRECWCLVVTGCGRNNFISMFVNSSCCCCRKLWLFFRLFFNFSNLYTLSWGRWNLHTKDYVPYFWLGQRNYVHTEKRMNLCQFSNLESKWLYVILIKNLMFRTMVTNRLFSFIKKTLNSSDSEIEFFFYNLLIFEYMQKLYIGKFSCKLLFAFCSIKGKDKFPLGLMFAV